MTADDYIDLDELHDPPDLVKINEGGYLEIPQTKRQRLATLAEWHRCGIGELSEEVLQRYGLTARERNEAAMDAAKVARDARETAELAQHVLAPSAEEQPEGGDP